MLSLCERFCAFRSPKGCGLRSQSVHNNYQHFAGAPARGSYSYQRKCTDYVNIWNTLIANS
jgi:hypothetical protein